MAGSLVGKVVNQRPHPRGRHGKRDKDPDEGDSFRVVDFDEVGVGAAKHLLGIQGLDLGL